MGSKRPATLSPIGLSDDSDDSPFLSMADFFSLLSLTLLAIIVSYSSMRGLPRSDVEVISAVVSGKGQVSAIDEGTAYVAVVADGPNVIVRIVHGITGQLEEISLPAEKASAAKIRDWAKGRLSQSPKTKRVAVYFEAETESAEIHRIFFTLVSDMRPTYEMSIILGPLEVPR